MDIQDKIRKLLALANNKGATEGEAANAMAMATALMAKHNIDHIADKTPVHVDSRREEFDTWQVWLHTIAGELNGCENLVYRSAGPTYVGRPENTAAAWQMTDYLIAQVETFYKQALPQGLTKAARAEFRRTFKQAAALRVYNRGKDILDTLRTKDNQISGSTALVVAQTFDQLMSEAQEFLASKGVKLKYRTSKVRGGMGTRAGQEAGNRVNINTRMT